MAKLSLSGYIGKIDEEFDINIISELISALTTYLNNKGKVAIGYDNKISSEMIKYCVFSSLLAGGIEIYELGKILTSNLQIFIKENNLDAGVMIGGFGNEENINGIRFFRKDGLQFSNNEMQPIFDIYKLHKINYVKWDKLGNIINIDPKELYFKKIEEFLPDLKILKDKKIKVHIYGFKNTIFDYFKIAAQKFDFVLSDKRPDLSFEINSDSSISSIKINKIKIATQKIFPLVLYLFLNENKKEKIVTNYSSTFILKNFKNIEIIETKAGMENIAEKTLSETCKIAGEGCGSVLFSDFVYGYDALLTALFIITKYVKNEEAIIKIIKEMPDYFYYKKMIKINPDSIYSVINNLIKSLNKRYNIITYDGIKIFNKNLWITIRPSNNKNVIRIIGEAKDKKDVFMNIVKNIEKEILKWS